MGKTRKCGLYIRVSTEEQAQKEEGSLKNQRARMNRFVVEKNRHAEDYNTGDEWLIHDFYEENPKSAKNTDRPKYQQLMSDIEGGLVNTILFTELSRLPRSTKDFLELCGFLEDHDADFVCLQHPELNSTSAHGRILMTMLVAMMQFEREINVDRSQKSFQERSGRGLWTGGQLLGYDLMDEKMKGHMKINEAEKKIVQFIFRKYIETGSIGKVVKLCRQHGYKSKTYESRRKETHHGTDFTYTSIKQLLANLAYVAKKQLGRPRRVKGKNGEWRTVASPITPKVIATDCWERIIEQADFDKVQDMLAVSSRSRMPAKASKGEHIYLLGQSLFCNQCREMLTNGGPHKDGVLVPHYVHRHGTKADFCVLPPNINAERLDEVVWERIARNLSDADLQRWAEEAQQSEQKKGVEDIQAEVVETQKALKAKTDSHKNIIGAFHGGEADGETKKLLGVLAEDIAALRQRLAEQKGELEAARQKQAAVAGKPKSVARMRATALKDLDDAQKREILKLLVSRVELTPNSIVLNPVQGDPIVGEVRERQGVRSGRWRFIDVEWLN